MKRLTLILSFLVFSSMVQAQELDSYYGSFAPIESVGCTALNIFSVVTIAPSQYRSSAPTISNGCFQFGSNNCAPGEGGSIDGSFHYGSRESVVNTFPTIHMGRFTFGPSSDFSQAPYIDLGGFQFGPQTVITISLSQDQILTITSALPSGEQSSCLLSKLE